MVVGKLCEWVHDNQCSIAGTYQPRLPAGSATKFVGASSYKYAWKFLMMPATATLEEVAFRGRYYDKCWLATIPCGCSECRYQ